MADENVVNGKLLLVNAGDGNYPSDYNYTMPEHTKSDMYYTYMEVIIPTDKIQTYDANEEFAIMFGNSSETTMFFRGFSNGSSGEGHIEILMRPNGVDPVFPTITNMDEINTLFSNEYVVVSLMILPKLNKNPLITPDSIYTNSLAVFINGIQLKFEYNDTNIPLLPLPSMLNGGNFIRNYSIPNGSYMIFNTEYERFIYKNLANMCYTTQLASTGTYISAGNIPYLDLKYYNPTELKIVRNSASKEKFIGNDCFFTINENDKYGFYIELEFDNTFSMKSASSKLGFYSFGEYLDYNKFDKMYKPEYSLDTTPWDESYDDNDPYKSHPGYIFYVTTTGSDLGEIYVGGELLQFDTPGGTSGKFTIVIYSKKNENNLYDIYVSVIDTTNWDGETYLEFTPTLLYTDKHLADNNVMYGLNWSQDSTINYVDFTINTGYNRYKTKPKDDELFEESMNRVTANAHWKDLMKHSRTIQFTTYLQDNPVIFPLDLFRNNDENMFVEIKVERQNNSKVEYAVGTGIELYDSTDNENIKNIDKGLWHCEGSALDNANVLGHKTGASVGGGDLKNYYSIALYYNIKRSKKCIYVLSSDGAGIDESDNRYFKKINVKEDNIDITNFKNIYVHLIPEDKESSVVGTELGTITINFGPTALNSDFQKYIDELLKQDELPDIQYHKTNIFKNHNYHVLTPYFGYDMDNDVIAGYDKGVWK